MVNFGLNMASLIGIINSLFAIFYFALSIAQTIVTIRQSGSAISIATRLTQIVIAPLCLLISGLIFIVQGWRFDPIMELGLLLIELVLFYYIIRDITSMNRTP